MAGRPQRRPTPASQRGRAPHPVAPKREPLDTRPEPGPIGRAPGPRPVRIEPRTRTTRPLSDAYRAALDVDLDLDDSLDAAAARRAFLRSEARQNGGKVTGAAAVAAALMGEIVGNGRLTVAAAKELADRTEGPVAQRVEAVSTRFVVSVTPGGGSSLAPLPASPEEWERAVRADLEARERADAMAGAALLPPPAPGEGDE